MSSCDDCIYAKLVETVNEGYIVCTNDNYPIVFPEYFGKCKYQTKRNKKKNKKGVKNDL